MRRLRKLWRALRAMLLRRRVMRDIRRARTAQPISDLLRDRSPYLDPERRVISLATWREG